MSKYDIRKQVRISFADGSDIDRLITSRKRSFEVPALATKRMLIRYDQILHASRTPNPQFVSQVAQVVTSQNMNLLFQNNYPTKADMIMVINNSTLSEVQQTEITKQITQMHFADFAKFIEALENFYGS